MPHRRQAPSLLRSEQGSPASRRICGMIMRTGFVLLSVCPPGCLGSVLARTKVVCRFSEPAESQPGWVMQDCLCHTYVVLGETCRRVNVPVTPHQILSLQKAHWPSTWEKTPLSEIPKDEARAMQSYKAGVA